MTHPVQDIHTMDDFNQILKESQEHSVLLFKYSPICPISFRAQSEFEQFLKSVPQDLKIYQINVVKDKPTSRELATQIGVTHESPQVLLFLNQQCTWNASHGEITEKNLQTHTSRI